MSINIWGPFEFSRIYGVDAEHDTVYLTRARIGRLGVHIFHRGDEDPDPHDHPWDFWTFPLVSYLEEVTETITLPRPPHGDEVNLVRYQERSWNAVNRFRLHYRPATYTHRVLFALKGNGDSCTPKEGEHRKIITIVWRSRIKRKWGFLRNDCWVPWKQYVKYGGKSAPCAEIEGAKLTSSRGRRK